MPSICDPVFWDAVTAITSALGLVLVLGGLVFAGKQLKAQTRATQLSYVLELHRDFERIRDD